ncbi:MAG: manganese efflux pump MntP family protein [Alteraurantiacibacter sp.]
MTALFLLALALAMDALVVSIARGVAGPHRLRPALDTGLAFGLAQGIMPLIGWALGALFAGLIEAVDHWIAFGLLGFLGVRMILAALGDAEQGSPAGAGQGASYWHALTAAAVATSIDAAAAGLTLDLLGVPVWFACLVIAAVTPALCVPGYWFAARIGQRFGRLAEMVGGVVLIGLGCKILVEHLA